MKIKRLIAKLLLDTGKGCSVCGHTPVVNVDGAYWLCGGCVMERLIDLQTYNECQEAARAAQKALKSGKQSPRRYKAARRDGEAGEG